MLVSLNPWKKGRVGGREDQHDWNRAFFTSYPVGDFNIDLKYDDALVAEVDYLENKPDERFGS